MTEQQIKEYKKLKAAQEWLLERQAAQENFQQRQAEIHRKNTEANIEYMRSNGTLTMGRM